MDASSIGFMSRIFKWLLNKIGYKIVPINNWNIEKVPVQLKWANEDPDILKEKQNRAIFRWADVRHSGFEYYEVLKGNTKERYRSGNLYLWVKRPTTKT